MLNITMERLLGYSPGDSFTTNICSSCQKPLYQTKFCGLSLQESTPIHIPPLADYSPRWASHKVACRRYRARTAQNRAVAGVSWAADRRGCTGVSVPSLCPPYTLTLQCIGVCGRSGARNGEHMFTAPKSLMQHQKQGYPTRALRKATYRRMLSLEER